MHADRRGSSIKADGIKRYMTGREPITTPSGDRIVDRKGRPSYVTTAEAAAIRRWAKSS